MSAKPSRRSAAVGVLAMTRPRTSQQAGGHDRRKDTAGWRRRRVLFEDALAVIAVSYSDDQLTVDDISHQIFSSRRQLQRAFAEAGTSVQECLHTVRMRRAAELLHESSLPVAQVARSVGYRQPPQFAKAFRRCYALTPSRWRHAAQSGSGEPSPPDRTESEASHRGLDLDHDDCVEACPVDAITSEDMVPPEWEKHIEINDPCYRDKAA